MTIRMIRWIVQPFLAFGLMMIYAGLMGKDRLKEYAIGNEVLLWEEYLIIVGICYLYLMLRRIIPRNGK